MTYLEWVKEHTKKVNKIKCTLENRGYSKDEIIKYFDYDNMIVKEPKFCLLYKDGKKCHDMEILNCYLCACPNFKFSDNVPIKDNVYSICSIKHKKSKVFEYNDKAHCDCSDCHYPHTKRTAIKFYDLPNYEFDDTVSLLEMIRSYQLSDILGKFKLF